MITLPSFSLWLFLSHDCEYERSVTEKEKGQATKRHNDRIAYLLVFEIWIGYTLYMFRSWNYKYKYKLHWVLSSFQVHAFFHAIVTNEKTQGWKERQRKFTSQLIPVCNLYWLAIITLNWKSLRQRQIEMETTLEPESEIWKFSKNLKILKIFGNF